MLSDRTDEGAEFTWFSSAQLFWFRQGLLYQPPKVGQHHITSQDIGRMTIGKAVLLSRWLKATREAEVEARNQAIEKARKGR